MVVLEDPEPLHRTHGVQQHRADTGAALGWQHVQPIQFHAGSRREPSQDSALAGAGGPADEELVGCCVGDAGRAQDRRNVRLTAEREESGVVLASLLSAVDEQGHRRSDDGSDSRNGQDLLGEGSWLRLLRAGSV